MARRLPGRDPLTGRFISLNKPVSAGVRSHRTKVKIERLEELKKKLQDMKVAAKIDEDVVVGYTASYAIYVHENLEARHKPGKQAKFLEEPARTLQPVMIQIVVRAMKRGVGLLAALLLAGLRLQRASQKIVPVDTGNLKNSAFTRIEKG